MPKINKHCFASDNYAGMAPEAWKALELANTGYEDAYGDDQWTARAADKIREVFETDCEVFFAFNGTASNALALAAMCQSYHSVLGHASAHIDNDECGAPEFFSHGSKLLVTTGANGKLEPEKVYAQATRRTDMHFPKPKVISLTQCTEHGTVYTPDELAALYEVADQLGLCMHMDGARFANAVAALEVSPKTLSWEAGVDVLCLGGSKNGMAIGDAIVFFNQSLAQEFEYRCKQAGQLASKMRYISAPWSAMLEQDIWLKHAAHANRCATLLSTELSKVKGVQLIMPVEANGVFVDLPRHIADGLRAAGWKFYDFIGDSGARFMCSWATVEADIHALMEDAKSLVAGPE